MVIVAASDLHRLFSAFAPLTRNPTLPSIQILCFFLHYVRSQLGASVYIIHSDPLWGIRPIRQSMIEPSSHPGGHRDVITTTEYMYSVEEAQNIDCEVRHIPTPYALQIIKHGASVEIGSLKVKRIAESICRITKLKNEESEQCPNPSQPWHIISSLEKGSYPTHAPFHIGQSYLLSPRCQFELGVSKPISYWKFLILEPKGRRFERQLVRHFALIPVFSPLGMPLPDFESLLHTSQPISRGHAVPSMTDSRWRC